MKLILVKAWNFCFCWYTSTGNTDPTLKRSTGCKPDILNCISVSDWGIKGAVNLLLPSGHYWVLKRSFLMPRLPADVTRGFPHIRGHDQNLKTISRQLQDILTNLKTILRDLKTWSRSHLQSCISRHKNIYLETTKSISQSSEDSAHSKWRYYLHNICWRTLLV